MLTSPSPSPSELMASIAGGAALPEPLPPEPPLEHADRARPATAPAATSVSRRVCLIVVSFVLASSRQGGVCRADRHLELVLPAPDEQDARTAQLLDLHGGRLLVLLQRHEGRTGVQVHEEPGRR